jgi:hippurate hydrolase
MLCHPPGDDRGLHNPKYDFHDANLVIGAAFWRRLVETYLRAT